MRGKVGRVLNLLVLAGVGLFEEGHWIGFSCGMTEEIVLFAIDQLYCELNSTNPIIQLQSDEE